MTVALADSTDGSYGEYPRKLTQGLVVLDSVAQTVLRPYFRGDIRFSHPESEDSFKIILEYRTSINDVR